MYEEAQTDHVAGESRLLTRGAKSRDEERNLVCLSSNSTGYRLLFPI